MLSAVQGASSWAILAGTYQPDRIPQSLKDDLAVRATRGPIISGFEGMAELFPALSYQYVLYGMGYKPDFSVHSHLYQDKEKASRIILQNQQLTQQMLPTLPKHREYIEKWLASNQF